MPQIPARSSRQEFLDAVDRMIGDAGQHVEEIDFGVETVEFGGADQAVDRGGALAAHIGACEQVVLAAQSDGAQGAFRGVVVCALKKVHGSPRCKSGPANSRSSRKHLKLRLKGDHPRQATQTEQLAEATQGRC